ncbi:CAP domain-containing protein [Histidinibacterium lentulum]|uniref:SCP domain-containing protein n=1 Tax=Histidinibacterium lentulum TaxID=2480588 RepID=A0A3N2R0W2_9RHOB|nr:CAP domain-containing protein [Histidinibacterium lentulum]ROU01110.1 hypothetical protein EAT49_11330 [Histidinibacterium lentulum]
MTRATDIERQLADLTNAERTSRGLAPLQLEMSLNLGAERHSKWMIESGTISHTGAGGTGHLARMQGAGFSVTDGFKTGENIGAVAIGGAPGYSDEVRAIHAGLMKSPDHRGNILRPEYEYIGIGLEIGTISGHLAMVATQKFGSTTGPVRLDDGSPGPAPAPPPVQVVFEGTAAADILTGNGGDNVLKGYGGNDVLKGGGGNDMMFGGGGNDVALGGMGDDNIQGGAGDDRLLGNAGKDVIKGQAGNDLLNGGGDDDALFGGGGRDILIGGGGNDRLLGGGHNDILHGGPGDDFLNGGPGSDELFGGGGKDVLVGGGGQDRLDGGGGDDLLLGGSGADTFVFRKLYGHDVILGFEGADRIELDRQLWGGAQLSRTDVARQFGEETNAGIVLRFGADSLTITGIDDLSDLADSLVFI